MVTAVGVTVAAVAAMVAVTAGRAGWAAVLVVLALALLALTLALVALLVYVALLALLYVKGYTGDVVATNTGFRVQARWSRSRSRSCRPRAEASVSRCL